jgi:hypothetical protein
VAGWRAKFTKETWIHKTNCSLAFWMLLPAHRNIKNNSDEQHAIVARELRSALWSAVGFSYICCELTLRSLAWFTTIHNAFAFVDWHSSVWTTQNQTHVHTNFFAPDHRYYHLDFPRASPSRYVRSAARGTLPNVTHPLQGFISLTPITTTKFVFTTAAFLSHRQRLRITHKVSVCDDRTAGNWHAAEICWKAKLSLTLRITVLMHMWEYRQLHTFLTSTSDGV